MKWINYYYMQGLNGFTKEGLVSYDESLIAEGQPVGVPEFPIFDTKTYDLQQKWQQPLINVPENQFAPFTKGS